MLWALKGRSSEPPVLKPDLLTLGQSIYLHQASLAFVLADTRGSSERAASPVKRLQTGNGSLFAFTVDFYYKQVNAIDLVSAVASTG